MTAAESVTACTAKLDGSKYYLTARVHVHDVHTDVLPILAAATLICTICLVLFCIYFYYVSRKGPQLHI